MDARTTLKRLGLVACVVVVVPALAWGIAAWQVEAGTTLFDDAEPEAPTTTPTTTEPATTTVAAPSTTTSPTTSTTTSSSTTSTTTSTVPPTQARPSGNLMAGDTGADVAAVQVMLIELGTDLVVTGVFDPPTAQAVANLQKFFGLAGTGIVDTETRQLLEIHSEAANCNILVVADSLVATRTGPWAAAFAVWA